MTNIEKWCQDNGIEFLEKLPPCEIIWLQVHCDICPYRFMDDNECTSLCNAWGEKEATDGHQ